MLPTLGQTFHLPIKPEDNFDSTCSYWMGTTLFIGGVKCFKNWDYYRSDHFVTSSIL